MTGTLSDKIIRNSHVKVKDICSFIKSCENIAEKGECHQCGRKLFCDSCKTICMDEHLWIPLSELKNLAGKELI